MTYRTRQRPESPLEIIQESTKQTFAPPPQGQYGNSSNSSQIPWSGDPRLVEGQDRFGGDLEGGEAGEGL